jgi:hypothetical protein
MSEETATLRKRTSESTAENKTAHVPSAKPKFCPDCGVKVVKADAKFCTDCGKPLSVEADEKTRTVLTTEEPDTDSITFASVLE